MTLHKEMSEKVKAYEDAYEASGVALKDIYRQKFHLMPPVGWLNDPNGLCYFKGEYYSFFQYSPYNVNGGEKYWGLYKSKDGLTWTYQGTPLSPSDAFDKDGVYSGSALVDGDTMYLYYTGNVKQPGDHDYIKSGREANTIMVSTKDGIHFSEKQLLMVNKDYPSDLSCHVRDPKVWKEKEHYYMVQGARTKEDHGEVLVFEADDPVNWRFRSKIKSDDDFGYMWECPDLFELDGKTVLSVSPQGLEADGLNYANVYQSGYFFLEGDFKDRYSLSEFKELDRGFDFYAPQTYTDKDGQRIMIGWMGVPDSEPFYDNPTKESGWNHCLTIPRVLSVTDGKLCQNPAPVLEKLRHDERCFDVSESMPVETKDVFEFYYEAADQQDQVSVVLNEGCSIEFDGEKCTLSFSNETLGGGRTSRGVEVDHLKNLRILADRSSLEVFINDGEEVFTTRIFPQDTQWHIEILKGNGALKLWSL